MADAIHMKARDVIAAKYAAQKDAVVRYVDYYSSRSMKYRVTDYDGTYGIAWAVAEKGEVVFFDYRLGNSINRGAATNHKANRSNTNLVKAASTNGAADMAIEVIGLQPVGILVEQLDSTNLATQFGTSDTDVNAALGGSALIHDPSSIALPAQAGSTLLNCESALYEALCKATSIQLSFDGKRRDLAPMLQVGQLGASSYARSHGEIGGASAWESEEGYHWAKDGDPDSDFNLILEVEEEIVVPLTLPGLPAAASGYQVAPEYLYVEVLATVRGPEWTLLSFNQ